MSDYALGSTVYIAFTTRAFATGVPTALVGGTMEIYENGDTTPIVEGGGKMVLTVSNNSIAGFNLVTITATTGNGFEAGKTYHLIVKTGTVGGTSIVGEVVGRFTLDASAAKAVIGTPVDLGGGTATVAGNLSDIEAETDDIGVAGAGLTNINLPDQTMNITGDITGNLTGSVGSVTGLTAADVNAIKLQTDKLAFTIANQVDCNVESVNTVTVNGTGAPGQEWGP